MRMLYLAIFCLLFSKTLSATPLEDVRSFSFALGVELIPEKIELLKQYNLVILDAENTTSETIQDLRNSGVLVAGYLSVGTIEKGRFWTKAAKPYRLDYWQDWDEWYADVSAPGYQRLMLKRIIPTLTSKGFDAIFLDNIDLVELYPNQSFGLSRLIKKIRKKLLSQNIILGTQNSANRLKFISKHFDFWNLEDVSTTYNFQKNRYILKSQPEIQENQESLCFAKSLGIKVFATDYLPPLSDKHPQIYANSCVCETIAYISDIYLESLPATVQTCENLP